MSPKYNFHFVRMSLILKNLQKKSAGVQKSWFPQLPDLSKDIPTISMVYGSSGHWKCEWYLESIFLVLGGHCVEQSTYTNHFMIEHIGLIRIITTNTTVCFISQLDNLQVYWATSAACKSRFTLITKLKLDLPSIQLC